MRELLLDEARRYGVPFGAERVLEIYGQDVVLDARGLVAWLDATT